MYKRNLGSAWPFPLFFNTLCAENIPPETQLHRPAVLHPSELTLAQFFYHLFALSIVAPLLVGLHRDLEGYALQLRLRKLRQLF